MNKKHIVITALITFAATTVFYLTTFGSTIYTALNSINDSSITGKMKQIERMIDKHYIGEYDTNAMEELALSGYVYGVGDIYTSYIGKSDFNDLKTTLYGNYVGIGIEVYVDSKDNLITVISSFDDSPAQKSGILPNDKIIAVDGTAVSGENYNDAINMIKGITKTSNENSIDLTIHRGDKKIDLNVKREKINNKTVKEKVVGDNIGYIRISKFDTNTDKDFNSAVKTLRDKNVKGIVIDLRDNPGGMLDVVINVADTVLPEGKIVSIKDKNGKEQIYSSDKEDLDLPICVLVNSNSASASEVLSGAIRDHKRGTLIGETTFGKGLVQSVYEFKDNTALKITTAKYYTPSGECINGVGIKPDIEISLSNDLEIPIQSLSLEQDVQLQKAIDLLSK